MKDMTKVVVVADALTISTLAAGFQITLSVIMRYYALLSVYAIYCRSHAVTNTNKDIFTTRCMLS